MKLTAIAVKNAKPKEKLYRLFDGGGLYLEITPAGGTYWRLKYRFNKKEKRLALGVYPMISLFEAREAREKAKKLLADNIDPSLERKKQKQVAATKSENTFELIAREWHSNNADKWSENYRNNLIHRLEMDIFPHIGNYPISEITPPELLSVFRKIEARGACEIAHRAKQTCGQIFRYAIATGRGDRDPAADLKGALKPVIHKHYSALDAKELPEFLQAIERNDARLYPQTKKAVKLLMLTFVRTSELINAKWEEFDFEVKEWHIPAERMKMKRPHIVPLSRQTIEILEEQRELTGQWQWVLPSVIKPRNPMSNNTILGAIKRLGYKDKTTGHGFRALAMSTIKEKLGYRHEVVDRQLAHAVGTKVDRAYDRAQFLDERAKMMQEWADYLDVAVSGEKVVKVDFRKGA